MTLERPVAGPREALARALGEWPTVTGFLEALTGEPLLAEVTSQHCVAPDPGDGLALTGERSVIRRTAWLRGRGGIPYLWAETAFVPARLPASAWRRLEQGSEPIGRVLADEGLDPVHLPALGATPPRLSEPVAPELVEAVVWRRAYRLGLGGRPVFAIREWFLQSVLDALAVSARRSGTGGAVPSGSSSP